MTITATPVHATFAAKLTGVQISKDVTPETIAQVRNLWHQHKLLIFREQEPDETDLVEFSRAFGDLEIHVRKEYLSPSHPELLYVSNIQQSGKNIGILADKEVGWHYDQIYLPQPAIGSLLCAVKIPPKQQGNTYFADMVAAFAALPTTTKQKLQGKTAIQSYEAFNRMYSVPTNEEQKKKTPDIKHPLIRTHPFTGEQALYLCPGMTTRINDLSEAESEDLLTELFEWTTRDEFVYCHEWEIGDCILWDNACTMHRRDPFSHEHQRLMKRTTILPPEAFAAPFHTNQKESA